MLISSVFVLPVQTLAGDQNHDHAAHGAHVHGEAKIRLVTDKKHLTIQFESPAMNIVGFEHAIQTDKQRADVNQAVALLKQPEKLFSLKGGDCHFEKTELDNPFKDEAEKHQHKHAKKDEHKPDKHEHKQDKQEHKHDKHDKHEHKHDKHERKHDKHERKHDKHEHKHDKHEHKHDKHEHAKEDSHKSHDEHREFVVEYRGHCKNTQQLSQVEFKVLNAFSGIERLDVEYIHSGKQGAQSFSGTAAVLKF